MTMLAVSVLSPLTAPRACAPGCGHHDDGHCFAHGAAESENYGREQAGAGGGRHRAEHAAFMRCAQSERALIIAFGTARMALSATPIMVGSIMIPSSTEAVSMDEPLPPKVSV